MVVVPALGVSTITAPGELPIALMVLVKTEELASMNVVVV